MCASQTLKCRTSFDPVEEMDCSGMNLTALLPNMLHLKEQVIIKKLTISHNKLNSSVSFKHWNRLIALDMSYNEVNNISTETFGSLDDLKLLNISYNNITMIDENAFKNMPVLEILDLSGNPLLGLKYDVLQKSLNSPFLWSLKKFVMTMSNLSSLPSNTFLQAHELQHLDLSDNNLTVIPVLPKNLVYFKVNNNSIKSIDIEPFQNTHLLKDFYIENNLLLTDIDIDAFETLKNLRNISFKGCKNLEYLPSRLFEFTKKIKHVSLADCNFKSLPPAFKYVFLNVPKIELQNNPWVCNASIKWFVFLESAQDENLRCAEPSNVTIADYYGVNIRHGVLRKILVGLVFVVFILFGLAIYYSFTVEKKRRSAMPYVPLDTKNPLVNHVYVTTVV